jgi:hypothetical protein
VNERVTSKNPLMNTRESRNHLRVTLGADDVGQLLLLSLLDKEASTLSLLLGDLLVLDGAGKLGAKGQVRDGNVVQDDVELLGTRVERLAAVCRHHLSLGDQLAGVVLGLRVRVCESRAHCTSDAVNDLVTYPTHVSNPQGLTTMALSTSLAMEGSTRSS